MKHIFTILFVVLLVTANSQITQRCPVCPPKLTGVPDGWCLKDSAGFAVWGPCSDAADSVFWHTSNGNLYPANVGLNVGIGTATPTTKLDVSGGVYFHKDNNNLGIFQNPLTGQTGIHSITNIDDVYFISSNRADSLDSPTDHEIFMTAININTSEAAGIAVLWDTAQGGFRANQYYDYTSDSNNYIVNQTWVDSNGFSFQNQGDILFRASAKGFIINIPSKGTGKVLTSDASGNATWQTLAGASGTGIPAYANNATAVAAIGAGKLYYTDVAGEYILKLSH